MNIMKVMIYIISLCNKIHGGEIYMFQNERFCTCGVNKEVPIVLTNIDEIDEEKNLQLAIIEIKEKYGKNAIFKGMNKLEKATTIKRNTLVGGHNAN